MAVGLNDENDKKDPTVYHPEKWEKILAYSVAVFIVLLTSYVIIRDKPFENPNNALFLRILLSLAVAVIGAVIPGFLNVGFDKKGWGIRAGGALALFVITFFGSPKVLPNINSSVNLDYPWVREMNQLNADFERLSSPILELTQSAEQRKQELTLRTEAIRELQQKHDRVITLIKSVQLDQLPSPKQLIRLRFYSAMAHYQVSSLAHLRLMWTPVLSDEQRLELQNTVITEAKLCSTAARDGLNWCDILVKYSPTNEKMGFDAPADWSPSQYQIDREWVSEGVDKDLVWYQTAGNAALAYFGEYDLKAARSEISSLMKDFPPWQKDPPQKDSLMKRVWEGHTHSDYKLLTSCLSEFEIPQTGLPLDANTSTTHQALQLSDSSNSAVQPSIDIALPVVALESHPKSAIDDISIILGIDFEKGPCCR